MDKIRIQAVGTFLKGDALTWHHMRKRTQKTQGLPDSWINFKKRI